MRWCLNYICYICTSEYLWYMGEYNKYTKCTKYTKWNSMFLLFSFESLKTWNLQIIIYKNRLYFVLKHTKWKYVLDVWRLEWWHLLFWCFIIITSSYDVWAQILFDFIFGTVGRRRTRDRIWMKYWWYMDGILIVSG